MSMVQYKSREDFMINLSLTQNEQKNLSKDEIEIAMARKLEILMLPHLRRHISFFYAGGNLKGKAQAYREVMDKKKIEDVYGFCH